MRILGVDPGYAIVGFGVLEYTGTTLHRLHTVQLPPPQKRRFYGGWRAFIGIFGR